jgi:hypothetical protein
MNEQATRVQTGVAEEIDWGDEAGIDVYCWRLEQLLSSGYSGALADALAADCEVDLHQACALIKRGCPQALAYAILA